MAFVLLVFLSALKVAISSSSTSCSAYYAADYRLLCNCICTENCHACQITGAACGYQCDCSFCYSRQNPNATHIEELLQLEAKMHKNMSLPKTTKNLTELSKGALTNVSLILP
mmetsp:Transcript_17462/g.32846  ORF Transcript_17462/g.32846 Transcript_17462/m.32846 type:complete len:113 (+) Transcript_17462:72-410(+)